MNSSAANPKIPESVPVRGLRLLLMLCALVLPSAQAWAAETTTETQLAAGARAYEAGDFAAALSNWRPLAQAGDADAQFALGTLYQSGQGVPRDDEQATAWFRKAAEQGSVPAQYNLGNAYKHGRGVQADEAQAVHWWTKAAKAGLAPAQFNLGTAYFYGRGVARSPERGMYWYGEAAANGHPAARAVLAQVARPQARLAAIRDAAWVKAQPPSHYTVQLLAAETEPKALRYVLTLPDGEYAVCAYRSKTRKWYAVLAGSFPSLEAAQQSAQSWRGRTEPWIRRFADLHAGLLE